MHQKTEEPSAGTTAPVKAAVSTGTTAPAANGSRMPNRMRRPRQGHSHSQGGDHRRSFGHGRSNSNSNPAPKNEVKKIPPPGENLRIIPLGGVEEIGKNMMLIEYKDDIIVIDAGVQFSDSETPGVDYIYLT